jgi:hypothetical protein
MTINSWANYNAEVASMSNVLKDIILSLFIIVANIILV